MKQTYFGSRQRPLYGVVASPPKPSREGVVLCYPAIFEYNQSHWAFKKLQMALARAGLHVMRFDYFGTGDSGGTVEEGNLAGWESDVQVAIDELTETANLRSVSVVGLGLGASLAVRAARKANLKTLVLWNPVLSGNRYLDALFAQDHEENLRLLHHERGPDRDELKGYPFTRELRLSLGALDLFREPLPKTKKVDIFVGAPTPLAEEYQQKLSANGAEARCQVVVEDGGTNEGAREAANLASKVLTAITEVLAPAAPKPAAPPLTATAPASTSTATPEQRSAP